MRKLEIGPGRKHRKGYETVGMEYSDVKWDVSKPLPFDDETYDMILASHVIEHIEWYRTQAVIRDWTRILKVGGELELWTPDFGLIIDIVAHAENGEKITPAETEAHGKWMKSHNKDRDPFIWANFRIFSIDSDATAIKYNRTHHSMFTQRHLTNQMEKAGLKDVRRLSCTPPYNHGWTNMGLIGVKS